MQKIYNVNPFNLIEYLDNKTMYQILNKRCYVMRVYDTLQYFSYKICILQVNMTTKTIYKNINKYSVITNNHITTILKNIPLEYFNIIETRGLKIC